MLKRTIILLTTVLLLVSSYSFAQNKPAWPKTFLWRISGNGLTKDSYLYGTMHMQDKRIFNFGDSLYRYMEKADGYAMELDMTEMMDSLIQRVIDEKTQYLDQEQRLENSRERKKIIDSLVKNIKDRKDKKSYKILERLRRKRMDAILKKEMPTIMDAFFYGIARRQGKWLGGVEDVQDQMPLLDEIGRDISSEELLISDKVLTGMMDKMISVYQSNDLNKIESFNAENRSKGDNDLSLIKRNLKMARRMDSLAHIRSMFFTVGVAHLPGDSGVITQLRQKGFRVDPVFSNNAIDPLQYVGGLKSIEWQKNEDQNKTYEIEMPGKASEVNVAEGLVRMKYYVDLSTFTFYMAASSEVNENVNLEKLFKDSFKDPNAKILSKKNLYLKGLNGLEASLYTDQSYLKIVYLLRENILYMLIVGCQKEEMLAGADANHFFSSFTPGKELPQAPKKDWKRFDLVDKGCSILFPGEPKRNPKLAQGPTNEWNYTTYDLSDPSLGVYYLLQVRDIMPGYHSLEDSIMFHNFRSLMQNSIKNITRNEVGLLEGYPALFYEGDAGGILFKAIIVNRGNRSYSVILSGAENPKVLPDMKNFLLSFKFLDYKHDDWQKQVQSAGNFQSLAPSSFILKVDTTSTVAEKNKPIHYVSYDSVDCTSYEILKYTVSPYYYATNDNALFHDLAASYRASTDSVLSEKWITNGTLKGLEWISQSPGNHNARRARIFINGDSVYYILCYLPCQRINEDSYQRFFTNFKVIKEEQHPDIYKRKIERILTDLQSKDSVIFSEAWEAFSKTQLLSSDKPILQEALLREYLDDAASGTNARDMICDSLNRWFDHGTLDFIKSKYGGITGNREFIKVNLLNLLVNNKTQESYNLLKELLINNPPKNVGEYMLAYRTTDSLELAKSLYPELLQLSNNPVMALRVMEITSVMLENKMIPVSMVDQYRGRFINTADTLYERLSKLDFIPRAYLVTDMLNLMQQLKDAEGNRILKRYLGLDNLEIKQNAIENLLKNNLPVDPKQIEKVAADKSYRIDFYNQLNKIKKTAVFPAAYNTQQSMAEADIYNYSIEEDYDPTEIKPAGVKTIKYKGVNYKFYLFRITYEGEDKDRKPLKEFYLGLSGPFSMDPKRLVPDSDLTYIFFDEEYDTKKTQKQIQDYLEYAEKEDTEEK